MAGTGKAGFSPDGQLAVASPIFKPRGIALDRASNLYFAEPRSLRRVDATTGRLRTVAGNDQGGVSGDGGPALAAGILPNSVDVDSFGNIYIADRTNSRVRRVDAATGIITTVAAMPVFEAVADDAGNVYVSHGDTDVVHRVDGETGQIDRVLGGGETIEDGQPGTDWQLLGPGPMALDGAGSLFIGTQVNLLRLDLTTGLADRIVGGGSTPLDDGVPGTESFVRAAAGVAVDAAGHLYFNEIQTNLTFRINSISGEARRIAGRDSGVTGDGLKAAQAILVGPTGVGADDDGNIYIVDNDRVRRVDAQNGTIDTFAGGGLEFPGDGFPATDVQLGAALLTVDGNRFVYSSGTHLVSRVDIGSGILHRLAGLAENPLPPAQAEWGPASLAAVDVVGLAVDSAGSLYLAEPSNDIVRRIDAEGIITTVVGTGSPGFSGDGGPTADAQLNGPQGLAFDGEDNLYIAEGGNHRVRRVDALTGIITTVAGNGSEAQYLGNFGPAIEATLPDPLGLVTDPDGNLFVSSRNQVLRVDALTGLIYSVTGGPNEIRLGDGGPALDVGLPSPVGLAQDPAGNLLIADQLQVRIRAIRAPIPVPDCVTDAKIPCGGAARLIHDFEFEDGLSDQLGGPDLIGEGTVAEGVYNFEAGEGLELPDALVDPANYSIELVFSFERIEDRNKVLDFKELATDEGLYVLDGMLILFPLQSTELRVAAGQTLHVVVVRRSLDDRFLLYLDGQLVRVGTDEEGFGIAAPGNLFFFRGQSLGRKPGFGGASRTHSHLRRESVA